MSGRRGGGGGSGRHHDYAGRVRQEINSVYNVYCRMFSAVKQQQTAGRLHADAESQIEGFRLDLAVATLVRRLCSSMAA
ncbi:hypothetical protein PTSG_12995 [Salpingoeca rosetta]|uniref:Uncharacterized protein n=1 Tax=Salpingoeca rosetta (strain ATCC 50818 / BSB-021) TaxID=946362 RepID=F2UPI9_SALR5|nr:uncharacterized protein PTSG_12995 [Salpingoeca rosetta]EGD79544.1 hypothetical protein PTSG_12995 [Salpingoeca rosetta]|eukprot:XP_004989025.1 hypothetical protein PTSG_12995 [Salpingoeca rosetta]